MKCDVLVIGAGPGGSMAAKTAAHAGLDVLLIEKRQEIGEPVRCAEGIGLKFDLKELIDLGPAWVSADIDKAKFHFPDGVTISSNGNGGGYVLERKEFDKGLALRAAECGAEVLVKARAVGLSRSEGKVQVSAFCRDEPLKIEARIVIGADGVESKTAQWAGMDSRLSPDDIMTCAQFLVSGPEFDQHCCEFFFGNSLTPGGYIWIFPKGKGLANVGIGLQGSRSGPGMPLWLLERFMERKMPQARVLQIMSGGIPTSGTMKNIASDGVMLVGDAAHQSDSLTGGGIITSMRAGVMAGEVAVKAVSSGDTSQEALREYEALWASSWGRHLEKWLKAKRFFCSLSDDDINRLAGAPCKGGTFPG